MEPRVGRRPERSPGQEAERALLRVFQGGDATAFHPLVRPHLPALLALARRHCRDRHWAEDLVQETLVRAYRGLAAFRGDAAVKTWLFRILVRLAAEPGRWRPHEQPQALDGRDVPDTFEDAPEHGAIARELQDRLDEAMERLTVRQRTALHLRAVEGMDYAGVAAVLECSQTAARMHVLEARRKVLARLGEHLGP